LNASIVDTAGQWWGRSWLSSPGEGEHETVVKFIGRIQCPSSWWTHPSRLTPAN